MNVLSQGTQPAAWRRYLIVNTSNWWLDHQVLIAPQWIQDVSWLDATVSVSLDRQAVKDAPPTTPPQSRSATRNPDSSGTTAVPVTGPTT